MSENAATWHRLMLASLPAARPRTEPNVLGALELRNIVEVRSDGHEKVSAVGYSNRDLGWHRFVQTLVPRSFRSR